MIGPFTGPGASILTPAGRILKGAGGTIKLVKNTQRLSQEGIIYKRINPKTGEEYIGKTIRDTKRFKEHDRDLGVKHRYMYLDEKVPRNKMSFFEQKRVNEAGGIKNLANKRNPMSEVRYKAAEIKFSKNIKK